MQCDELKFGECYVQIGNNIVSDMYEQFRFQTLVNYIPHPDDLATHS